MLNVWHALSVWHVWYVYQTINDKYQIFLALSNNVRWNWNDEQSNT